MRPQRKRHGNYMCHCCSWPIQRTKVLTNPMLNTSLVFHGCHVPVQKMRANNIPRNLKYIFHVPWSQYADSKDERIQTS
jgi:hypothetical protein